MLFSIIVPCYNCDNTITRLLDSIVIQNEKSLEVILVDDTEDHSFVKKINKYKKKLNISVVETELKYHNPGNSRNYGLDIAKGDWVLFIDCDDTFREGALNTFKNYINTKYSPCYVSCIKQWHEDNTEFTKDEEYQAKHIVWTHGKCYDRKFLNECGIRFKQDMKSCEDYWFNYMVLSNVLNKGMHFIDIPDYTYNWMWNSNSLSRSSLYIMSIKEHFYDHLQATLIPWVLVAFPKETQEVFQWYLYFLIIDYFLFQFFYKKGVFFKTDIVKESLSKTYSVFGISILDIINSVESNYSFWMDAYKATQGIVHEDFVCQQSFREWMLNMYK